MDRIREMLDEIEKHGFEEFRENQSDVKSKKAESITPVFIKAINSGKNLTSKEEEALELLNNWDFRLSKQSSAASVFEILYRKTGENLVRDELSPENSKALMGQRILVENLILQILTEGSSVWIDDINTNDVETFENIVLRSFTESVNELTNTFGQNTSDWNWGKIHTITIKHPLGIVNILDKVFGLNKGPFEVPGSYHTVSPFSYSFNNLYEVNHGASHRNIFDLANWDISKIVIPTGTSGIPSSNFYLDQTEMYINYEYHPDPFSKTEVEKEAKFRMKLLPK